MVVVYDGDHRQLLARHVPECRRTEDERTVANQANDLLVGARQLHPGSGSDTGTKMRAIIEEQLPPAGGIETKAVQPYGAGFVHDDGVFVGKLGDSTPLPAMLPTQRLWLSGKLQKTCRTCVTGVPISSASLTALSTALAL